MATSLAKLGLVYYLGHEGRCCPQLRRNLRKPSASDRKRGEDVEQDAELDMEENLM